jgi:hypothetical protein
VEKRALAVAKIVETPLATGLIGMKNDFDLPDKFLKPEIERSKNGGRVSPGAMHLLPTSLTCCDHSMAHQRRPAETP